MATPKPKSSPLEIEYKAAMADRDAARRIKNRAGVMQAEKRMAEIQVKMFHETASTVGASSDPKDFDRAFEQVSRTAPPPRKQG